MNPKSFKFLSCLNKNDFVHTKDLVKYLNSSERELRSIFEGLCEICVDLRKKGDLYFLEKKIEFISTSKLNEHLGSYIKNFKINTVFSCDSTNDHIKIIKNYKQSGLVLISEIQTFGKGRYGKQWLSEFGNSITFSFSWNFKRDSSLIKILSLLVGLTVVEVLEKNKIGDVFVKWPNDIIVENKKAGGILIELQNNKSNILSIIGVGLNFDLSDKIKSKINQPVSNIRSTHSNLSRNSIVSQILRQFFLNIKKYEKLKFIHFKENWERKNYHLGKNVSLILPNKQIVSGELVGIDIDGSLKIISKDKLLKFKNAEVSLR